MEYKDMAVYLAYRAGKIMRQNFQLGMTKMYKLDNSPVTESDIKINDIVIEEINQHFPDHSVFAEEKNKIEKKSLYTWVCDPIDGTSAFSHGLPISTFSIALTKNGQSIMGVIFDPFMDRLFFAEKGKGAFLNDKPIQVSESNSIEREFINLEGTSRVVYNLWDLYRILNGKKAKVANLHSTTYSSSLVAAGEFIATICPHDGCHDVAAAKIIVEEAGGKVTDLFGKDQKYDQQIKGAIISNGKVHDLLVEEVAKVLK